MALKFRFLEVIPRGLLMALYVVWVAIALFWLTQREVSLEAQPYKATRDLAVGHWLRERDLKTEYNLPWGNRSESQPTHSPVGMYLTCAKSKDQAVAIGDLSEDPIIAVADNKKTPYYFSLRNQAELKDILNAGSRVAVCADTCDIPDSRVISIVCATSSPPTCYAVLEASAEELKKIQEAKKPERLILVLRGNIAR